MTSCGRANEAASVANLRYQSKIAWYLLKNMRLDEVLLLVAALPLALAAIAWPTLLRGPARFWLLILFAAVAAHFAIESLYWQVAPCYLACVSLALITLFSTRIGLTPIRLAGVFSLLLLLASAVCLFVVPKFRLPTPTGPYAVGTKILHLTDPVRSDPTFKSGKREVMAQAWYPTDQRSRKRAPYRSFRDTTRLSSYDAVLLTHSVLNAPPAREARPFPVILFNPGWRGRRMQNTIQMEDLASHGFIVVAIDHTHNSEPVAFLDGQVIQADNSPDIEDFQGITLAQKIAAGSDEARQQADDDSLVLDALTGMTSDPSSVWHGAVDLNRVGAFGHSFGGAAAIQAAFQDPRVLSAMNMDGWVFGDIWQRTLGKPMMFLYEDGYPPTTADIDAAMRSGVRERQLDMQLTTQDQANVEHNLAVGGGYEIFIKGAKHMNFTDRTLYSPLRRLTGAGEINAARAHEIVNQYTLAFFSQTLRGTREPLLAQTPSPFPEVTLKIWPSHNAPQQ